MAAFSSFLYKINSPSGSLLLGAWYGIKLYVVPVS